MMSGLVSPQSIGLTDRVEIIKFIKLSKRLLLITHIITSKLIPIAAIILTLFPMIINCPLIILIFYVMPISFATSFITYVGSNFVIYQLVYFYLICYYLTIKMRKFNQMTKKLIRAKIDLNCGLFHKIMISLNKVYIEINDYNRNYWSIYLFWIWMLLTLIIVYGLYLSIFSKIFIIKCMLIFGSIIATLCLILVIRSASSVNYEANKTYKLMFSLVFSKKRNNFSKSFRIKVFVFKNYLIFNNF